MAGPKAIFAVWSHAFLEALSDIADGGQLVLCKQALLGGMLNLACLFPKVKISSHVRSS